ncbi:hypothetical protein OY671_012259, partial [Metschnikowia pulcherrima]
ALLPLHPVSPSAPRELPKTISRHRVRDRKGIVLANVTVIGAQWGDEGKGKIVDWSASRADAVVRFQGGHNAGHTSVVGDQVYKLSSSPSGIVTGTL